MYKLILIALLFATIHCGHEVKLYLADAKEGVPMNDSGWSDKQHGCVMYLLCSSKKTVVECPFELQGVPEPLQNAELPVYLHKHKCGASPNPHYKNEQSEVKVLESNEVWIKTKLTNSTDEEAIGRAEFWVRTQNEQRPESIMIHNPDNQKPMLCYNLYYYNKNLSPGDYCKEALESILEKEEVQYIDYSKLSGSIMTLAYNMLILLFIVLA